MLSEVGQLQKGKPWGLGGGEQKLSERAWALCVKAPSFNPKHQGRELQELRLCVLLSEVVGAVREAEDRVGGFHLLGTFEVGSRILQPGKMLGS